MSIDKFYISSNVLQNYFVFHIMYSINYIKSICSFVQINHVLKKFFWKIKATLVISKFYILSELACAYINFISVIMFVSVIKSYFSRFPLLFLSFIKTTVFLPTHSHSNFLLRTQFKTFKSFFLLYFFILQ